MHPLKTQNVTAYSAALPAIQKYPLSHYMAYGWDGLTKYGYTAKRLTIAENTNNQNLRSIVNQNSQICK